MVQTSFLNSLFNFKNLKVNVLVLSLAIALVALASCSGSGIGADSYTSVTSIKGNTSTTTPSATITAITPTTAGFSENTVFTFTGTNLVSGTYSTTIDKATCASTTFRSSTSIQATCLTPATGNYVTITLTKSDNTINQAFTIPLQAATFTSISPTRAAYGARETFTIVGSRISPILYSATFGVNVCEANYSSSSSINVTCTAPSTSDTSANLILKDAGGTTLISYPVSLYAKASITALNPSVVVRETTRTISISGVNFSATKTYSGTLTGTGVTATTCTSVKYVSATELSAVCYIPTVSAAGTILSLNITEDTISIGTPTLTVNTQSLANSSITAVYPTSAPQSSIKEYKITGSNFIEGDTNYKVTINGIVCTEVSVNSTTQLRAVCTAPASGTTTTMYVYKGDVNNIAHQLGSLSLTLTTASSVATVSPIVAVPDQAGVDFTFTGNNLLSDANYYIVNLGGNSCSNVTVNSATSLSAKCNTPSTSGSGGFYPTFTIRKRSDNSLVDGSGAIYEGGTGRLKLYLSTIIKVTATPKIFTVYRVATDKPSYSASQINITVEATGGLTDATTLISTPECPSWTLQPGGTETKREFTCIPANRPTDPKKPVLYTFQDGVQGLSAKVTVTTDNGFTKINAQGEALPIQDGKFVNTTTDRTAAENAGTYWNCVRDNKQNLIWKVNTAEGLFSSSKTDNVGAVKINMEYINGLSENAVCGKSTPITDGNYNFQTDPKRWRLPTFNEMKNYLVNVLKSPAVIDVDYFPNITTSLPYWTHNEKEPVDSSANILTRENYARFCSVDLSLGSPKQVFGSGFSESYASWGYETLEPANIRELAPWCGVSAENSSTPSSITLPQIYVRYGE